MTAPARADWRRDSSFTPPERIPWSELGPEFATIWGRADPANPQPEHLEIVGPSGSGKTHLEATMLQERAVVRDTPSVMVATKPADETILKLGWPVVSDWRERLPVLASLAGAGYVFVWGSSGTGRGVIGGVGGLRAPPPPKGGFRLLGELRGGGRKEET